MVEKCVQSHVIGSNIVNQINIQNINKHIKRTQDLKHLNVIILFSSAEEHKTNKNKSIKKEYKRYSMFLINIHSGSKVERPATF